MDILTRKEQAELLRMARWEFKKIGVKVLDLKIINQYRHAWILSFAPNNYHVWTSNLWRWQVDGEVEIRRFTSAKGAREYLNKIGS